MSVDSQPTETNHLEPTDGEVKPRCLAAVAVSALERHIGPSHKLRRRIRPQINAHNLLVDHNEVVDVALFQHVGPEVVEADLLGRVASRRILPEQVGDGKTKVEEHCGSDFHATSRRSRRHFGPYL